MEEINLKDMFDYYLKRLYIIAIIVGLAIFWGIIYITKIQVPLYQSNTTIILVQKNSNTISSGTIKSEVELNESLVTTYSEIVKSRRVLEQVISNLNLKEDVSTLSDRINVTSIAETAIIKLSVSDKNNNKAVLIANELARVFKNEIVKIYNLENVFIIDTAIASDEPYNINFPKQITIYVLVAIVLSCGIIFVMYYFDNTIKNAKEIEEKIDLPVIGEIPYVKLKN